MAGSGPRPPRLAYVDWLRGVAVLTMIVWHVMDAWTLPAARRGPAFAVVVFLGGWAAPLFLFLAGVSLSLAGQAGLRAASRREVAWRLQKRGWQIFGLAHLFRLQSFLLNPTASWSSLLKPDILNVLGLGLVATALAWGRAGTRARQAAWLLVPAGAIVLLTPASRAWTWPARWLAPISPRLEAYIHPVANLGVFTLFPWVAFVFAGAAVGAQIAMTPSAGRGPRALGGLALAGMAIVVAGAVGAGLPALVPSEFWKTSASWFLVRVGAMTIALTLGGLWLDWAERVGNHLAARLVWWRRLARSRLASPLLLFGRASLFVYWTHVELAYGIFSRPLHRALPLGWALAGLAGLTLVMLMAAKLWIERPRPLFGRPAASGPPPLARGAGAV